MSQLHKARKRLRETAAQTEAPFNPSRSTKCEQTVLPGCLRLLLILATANPLSLQEGLRLLMRSRPASEACEVWKSEGSIRNKARGSRLRNFSNWASGLNAGAADYCAWLHEVRRVEHPPGSAHSSPRSRHVLRTSVYTPANRWKGRCTKTLVWLTRNVPREVWVAGQMR